MSEVVVLLIVGLLFIPGRVVEAADVGVPVSIANQHNASGRNFHARHPRLDRFPSREVWMHSEEQSLLLKYLTGSQVMLEWGSGGSTTYFSLWTQRYYSIEHNPEWYAKVRSKLNASLSSFQHVTYHLETVVSGFRGWKGALAPATFAQFHSYVKAPGRAFPEIVFLDRVLVDGRARVAFNLCTSLLE
uniref:Uncharacterized protein n=1 Tax=Tetraselmis sp. GSL018 TaxID=582737 RepID=A0A061RVM8_9CHLO